MNIFPKFAKRAPVGDPRHVRDDGYYSLAEPYAAAWNEPDDDWGQPPAPEKPNGRKRRLAARIVAGLLLILILLIGYLAVTAPLSKSLEPLAPPQITLLAADGTPIARKGAVVDAPVNVSKLPPHVVEAFLAIEDRRFYSHLGIDPRGLARAAITGVGGGSTITQQLAKFTFLTPEQTLTRKAREMLIAFWLEAWLTKEEILERYLSNAYFGDNTYGLRAASLHFFYRQPERLTPAQAAMLAGLLQAPSAYNPVKHYERAKRRMQLVVGSMVDAGYISEAEAARMRAPRLDVRRKDDLPVGTYFADWLMPQAQQSVGQGYAGRKVTTTLDMRMQRAAEQAVRRAPTGGAQVALVAMRTNGEVVAMVGGKDYARSSFNRATQAKRQPGSTFKLFVYLTALRQGMSPDDTIANTPITEGTYRPKNARGSYSDTISLSNAFAQSSNVAAVRLISDVGTKNVIDTARALGVTSPLDPGDPTMALGTSEMTLLELTAAYAAVAANAYPLEPHGLPRGEMGWFDRLTSGPSSFSRGTHEAMLGMMRRTVSDGTGRAARLSVPAFGKTGTSQDYRDAVFVGFAGDLVVGVWVGNDDNTPLAGVTGGGLPAQIWRDFMTRALRVGGPPAPAPTPVEEPADAVIIGKDGLPVLPEFPLGDGDTGVILRDGEAVLQTDVNGVPVDIGIGRNGVRIDGEAIDEARRRAREQVQEAEDRLREAQEQAAEDARATIERAREGRGP
jgi:penicillin-binding protein 1A